MTLGSHVPPSVPRRAGRATSECLVPFDMAISGLPGSSGHALGGGHSTKPAPDSRGAVPWPCSCPAFLGVPLKPVPRACLGLSGSPGLGWRRGRLGGGGGEPVEGPLEKQWVATVMSTQGLMFLQCYRRGSGGSEQLGSGGLGARPTLPALHKACAPLSVAWWERGRPGGA